MTTNEGSDVMYCHGVENIELITLPSGGSMLSPFLVMEIGDGDDDGVDAIAQVYALLKNKLRVPFFVVSKKASIYVSTEV